MSATRLGVDAGGSGTKWVLARGGVAVARGVTPPLTSLLLQTPEGAAHLDALVQAVGERPQAVHLGLPGLSQGSARASQVAAQVARAFGLGPDAVRVESDLDLAYRAHFQPGAGILVYAGTGSIAYHVTSGGEVVRAGGRGYRLGDDGGGFSLGRAALRVLTDALDVGGPPDTPLAREVAALTGGLDWDTLRGFAYGTPGAAAIASLAPAVGRAADQGDPQALVLVRDAAASLADLARRVQVHTGPLPVTASGGAFRISPLLGQELTAHLSGVQVVPGDHALAAALGS